MNATSNNTIILRGTLGGDPVQKGGTCVELRLCTTRGRGESEVAEWHNIKVFGQLGEQCVKYLKKGRFIGVVGRLTYYRTDPEKTADARAHTYAEVVADQVDFF